MDKINIPLNFEIKGSVKSLELIDTRTGKVEKKITNINNMLLGEYLNGIFEEITVPLLCHTEETSNSYNLNPIDCFIGSNGTSPTKSDNYILSSLASVQYTNKTISSLGDNPHYGEYEYIFEAGVGTGTIREIGIRGSTNMGSISVSRVALDTEIIKEDYHKLILTWRYEISKPTSWSGIISGGQRDGITDINWKIFIPDSAWYKYAQNKKVYADYVNPFLQLFKLFGSESPIIKVGTDNSDSDLANDLDFIIKGTELLNASINLHEVDVYVTDSFQNTFRVGIEENQSNGSIGEISIKNGASGFGLFRATFNPKLDKISGYRLYLDFTISISDGNNP